MKSHTKRSFFNKQEIEMDPYSTSILEQLLQNNNQWKGSQQIIKLTFRAMSDILQIHGQSIKDIKHVLTTRASKNQLTTGLSLKANISDISNTIDQISTQIQQRPSYSALNKILKQYMPRAQIGKNAMLTDTMYMNMNNMNNTNINPNKQIQPKQQSKANFSTTNLQLQIIQTRMDQFQHQIGKQISNYVTLNQFHQALNIIDHKVNKNQLKQYINNHVIDMDNLVNKQFLTTCLQKKVNKSELQSYLQTKADVNDLEYIVNSLQSKVNLSTLQKLTQVIQNKADKSDLLMVINEKNTLSRSNKRNIQLSNNKNNIQSSLINNSKLQQLKLQLQTQLTSISQRLNQITQSKFQQQSLSKKISIVSTQLHQLIHFNKLQFSKLISQQKIQLNQNISLLKNQYKILSQQINYKKNNQTIVRQLNNQISLRKRCEEKIYEEIDQLRKKYEEISHKMYQKQQTIKDLVKDDIYRILQNKIDKDILAKSLISLQNSIYSKYQKDNQTNTLLLQKLQKTYSQAISTNTTDIIKLTKTLSKKQDKYQFTIIQQNMKKSRKQIQQCRKTVDKIYQQLQSKLSISEYENDLLQIKKRFDKLFKQIQTKANIKDVCILADSKPNIDDVNNALKQLNQVLNQKISQNQLQNILKDQSAINQTLCSQNIVGRWMWQSGELKPGALVPWEIQSANTVPEHFFWEKDKSSILILAPGIYQIKACVFNKNSNINLMINGQNITTDTNKNDQNYNTINNIRNKSISHNNKKKSKNNNINGNSIQQFVILPARSRVSLSCIGDVAEGFLNIKRL